MMFIDIETIPAVKSLRDLDTRGQELFMERFNRQLQEAKSPQEVWVDSAALHAEFGRVLCASIGIKNVTKNKDEEEKVEFRVKSIAARDEKLILLKLTEILLKETYLCGHNIKAFDLPFLFRRLIINSLPVPQCLQIAGLKPWNIPHDDTLEMWACGDFGSKISLDRLAYALSLPSPKTTICGSDVGPLWYSESAVEELPFDRDERVLNIIKKYCEGDVITQANCFYRLKGLPIILPEQVVYV